MLLFQTGKTKELRVILYYLIYSICNELLTLYFNKVLRISAFLLFDVFTVIEFILFSLFFYLIITNSKIRKLTFLLLIGFVIFSVVDYLFIRKKNSFNSITSGIEAVLIIIMCIYYFFDRLKQPNPALLGSFNFWIIIAFLIYLAGTFFLFIMAENMIRDRSFQIQYVIINSSFEILKNILLSIAMFMQPTPNPQNTFPEDSFNKDWDDYQSLKNQN